MWEVLPISSRRDHNPEGNRIRETLMFIVPQWFMKPPEQDDPGRERTLLRKSCSGLRSEPICSDFSRFHLLLRWLPTRGRAEAQMGSPVGYTHCLYLPTAAKRKWEENWNIQKHSTGTIETQSKDIPDRSKPLLIWKGPGDLFLLPIIRKVRDDVRRTLLNEARACVCLYRDLVIFKGMISVFQNVGSAWNTVVFFFRLLKLDLLAAYGLCHIKLHSRFSSANITLGHNQ